MHRNTKIFMITLMLGGMTGIAGWLLRTNKKEPPVTMTTEKPVKMDIINKKVISGNLAPQKEVEIITQVAGVVDKLYVAVGDEVKPGTVIAHIKPMPKPHQIISAEKALNLAQIELEEAKAKYQRNQQLFEKKIVPPEQYESHVKSWKKAEEEALFAQKQLDLLLKGQGNNGSHSPNVITSTVRGTVVDLPYKEGSAVVDSNEMKVGSTLAVVADMNILLFQGEVGEMDVAYLGKGIQFDISVHAIKGKKFSVILTKVAPKATDARDGVGIRFPIEGIVQLEKEDSAILRSGYTAVADIILERAMNVWAIKEKCLRKDEDAYFVWIYENEQKVKKPVKLGVSDSIHIEIKEGLTENDLVIVE